MEDLARHAFIIVDDAADDALAAASRSHDGSGVEHQVIRLSDFLRQSGVEYDAGAGDLRSTESRSGPSKPISVLDRVVEISPQTLANLDGQAGVLRRGQVSYVYEALLRTNSASMGEKAYSTVGKLLPLPTQWRIISAEFPTLQVPGYRHGYGPELVSAEGLRRPVFKSPFDLYSWKPNERPEEVVWDQFIVDAPTGTPVLSYLLGSVAITAELRPSEAELSADLSKRLSDLTVQIGATFAAKVGEVLWFIDHDRIVFACFSHSLSAARRQQDFSPHAQAYLDLYFQERQPA